MKSFAALIDERHAPPLRHTLGQLLTHARTADLAVAHLRLAGLDLSAAEIGSLTSCRLMIGQLDATVLFDAASGTSAEQLRRLAAFAASGRLHMRTARHHTWTPDFSVFGGLPADGTVALLGAHYFGRPYPLFGIAFTGVFTGAAAVRLCRARFDELWNAGYDVLPVVMDTLRQLIGHAR